MTTLNTAFQTLLSSVGDLNLNDGDFLKMNNLLKKAYDSNTETLTEPIDVKLKLRNGIDTYEVITFDFYEIIREKKDTTEAQFINYKLTYKKETKLHSIKPKELYKSIKSWIVRARPMACDIIHDGFTTTYYYDDNYIELLKSEDNVDVDDDDCVPSYSYHPVMTERFVGLFINFLTTIADI